jgi:excisionase family DNA binding protein
LNEPTNQPISPALTSLTVKQVAVIVGAPAPTLYQLIERGEFPAHKLGGRIHIWRRQLINWLVQAGAAADEAEAEIIIERHLAAEPPKKRNRGRLGRPVGLV